MGIIVLRLFSVNHLRVHSPCLPKFSAPENWWTFWSQRRGKWCHREDQKMSWEWNNTGNPWNPGNLLIYVFKAFTFDSGRRNESGRQMSMVKLTWNAEKQVMLRSIQSAEKHAFVVTLSSCLFFWWKWWNLNAEKQVMLRSTQSAEKHALLWHYHVYFFNGNDET